MVEVTMRTGPALVCALLLATAGCGAHAGAAAAHDAPAPAGEARAEVRLRLDLPPATGCEQRFDLALYQDRAIELIAWDGQRGGCEGRVAVIRYLSAHRSRADVIAAAARLATRAAALAPEGPR
jgi:hypothetical protein